MASLKRLSSPQMYTIGWITALDKELTASRAVLDEEHLKPENFRKHSKDTNSYVWGRIGDHNIVIASLAAGKYGTVSAATTAWSMISSLPHLRFGLMVGIGAGIPRLADKVDIRLGDVVISQPSGISSGVIQYDLGKLQGDGQFKRVGSLASPPEVLLKGLTALKAERRLSGPRTRQILDDMIRRHPLLAETESDDAAFVYQGVQNDKLFKASSRHIQPLDQDSVMPPASTVLQDQNRLLSALVWVWLHLWRSLLWLLSAPLAAGGANVARVNNQGDDADLRVTHSKSYAYCDSHQEIKRRERPSSDPVVHYGVIASGDSVVKDGISRDEISRRLGNECICFEMEAAGLMDNFPCLVIRGICDYADTHKNDRWQNYPAATAAALAKELLGVIDSDDVEESSRMDEIMEQLQEDVSQIHSTTKDVQRSLHFQEVMKWLSAPDPSTNDNKAFKQRHENTGQWLVDSEKYSKWKKTPNSSLWLHGIPGCGKTILSSVAINDLRHAEFCFTYLYFYFDFSDNSKQSLESALRSLIAQLYHRHEDAQQHLDLLYSSNAPRQLSIDQLSMVFTAMAKQVGEVWIVLDALDECQTRTGRDNEGLLPWIESILVSQQANIHLLVTSRPEHDIKSTLERHIENQISLQSDLVTEDIRAYVHARVTQSGGLERRWRKRKEIQDDIEKHLLEKANGMFRWAACQIDELEECLDPQTLRETLQLLPRTLDETYARIIDRIPPKLKRSAIRILQFLTYSKGRLRIDEMCDAIAVAPQSTPRFNIQNRMPVPEEIAGYCSSLVNVVTRTDDNGKDTIKELQLAHFSVKEYLISDRVEGSLSADFREPLARAIITEVCLSYLLELDIKLSPENIGQSYPLAKYAARSWMGHAALAETSRVRNIIREFCLQEDVHTICYQLYNPALPWEEKPFQYL
ncbi:pfs domain-containing protein [Colletotrichum truncatum]|uniref:Pfs domain-containing protein n=1 Tax=Colletotrichum truncatum TaxID=5467 RepID=A0ACC3YDH7_COLTU